MTIKFYSKILQKEARFNRAFIVFYKVFLWEECYYFINNKPHE